MQAIPARVIATCFAFACFAGSVAVGVYSGNNGLSIMVSSMIAMFAAYMVGLIIGAIAQRGVDEHIRRHKEANPIPKDTAFSRGAKAQDEDTGLDAPRGASNAIPPG